MLKNDYPQLTPYNYAGNKPVTGKDLEGLQGTQDDKVEKKNKTEEKKPKTIFKSGVNQENIPESSINILEEIATKAGIEKLTITSGQRSPEKQAQVMFNDLKGGNPDNYANPGEKVQNVYYKMKENYTDKKIIQAMEEKIRELGPSNVSNHAADPSKLTVVDISDAKFSKAEARSFANVLQEYKEKGVLKEFYSPGVWGLKVV